MPDPLYPGDEIVAAPQMALTHTIEIAAPPSVIWPWIVQLGYHRAGWYIDTWWDRWEQNYFWPKLVPPAERGFWQAAAEEILPEYQGLRVGDTVPDGPPGTAYYIVTELEPECALVMVSRSHLKYIAPRGWWGTPREPTGAFSWAFILEPLAPDRTRLVSRWRGYGEPARFIALIKPAIVLADRLHQREILKGIRRRVEGVQARNAVAT